MDVGGWLGWIVRLNPLTYGVAGLRHYLQNASVVAALPSLRRRLLDRFAGVRRRDVRGRLVDRRHAIDRRFVMNSEPPTNSPPQPSASDCAPASGSALPYVMSLAVLIAMVYGGWKWWQVRQFEIAKSDAIPASAIGPPLTEFELTERSGKPFRSADMRGRCGSPATFSRPAPATAFG